MRDIDIGQRAKSLMISTFAFLFRFEPVECTSLSNLFGDGELQCCPVKADGEFFCRHVLPVEEAVSREGGHAEAVVAGLARIAASIASRCDAQRHVEQTLLRKVAASMDAAAPQAAHTRDADIGKNDFENSAKRRRVDEDFKAHILQRGATSKHGTTDRAYAQAHGAAESSAIRWEKEDSMIRISAAWLSFANSVDVAVCIDGSRFGQPAQDRRSHPKYRNRIFKALSTHLCVACV